MQSQNSNLISHFDPKSPVVEAFRTLRTNLQYANANESMRSLMVTSPGPGEGKSTITANLGFVLAQSGMKVTVVGCDLRKPSIHRYYQASNRLGVTSILVGQATVDDCLIKIPAADNLYFLPSGPIPPNPSELLGSSRMDKLLTDLESRSDIVLLDAPPVIAVTDAAILARKINGVLLVINMGTVPKEMAVRAKEQITKVGGRIIGVVLNRVDIKEGHGYYYYYYTHSDGEEVAASSS